MSWDRRPLVLALGLAASLAVGPASAQQPQQGLPAGHPPVPVQQGAQPPGQPRPMGQPGQPGQPGQSPALRQLPGRPGNLQPGRPIGPGGRQPPPGRPGGRAAVEAEPAHKAQSVDECPGHGPMDAPHHVNWWRGLIGVNNEAAEAGGFLNHLLWRYHNEQDPCDSKNEPPPYLAAVLNFSLLAFIVYRFGKKPVAEALMKRKQAIMGEIDNATRLKGEAEKRLEDYKGKLAHLEETLSELKAEHAIQAEAEKKHLLAELEERRARMRRDAEFRIEQELKAARAELLQEAVRGAVSAAEQIVLQQANAQDLERIAEDYLQSIPAALSPADAGRRPGLGAHSGASA